MQLTDAQERQRQLTRMKRRATGLLVAMAAVFVATLLLEPAHPAVGYVRAAAEAAVVGGLADWFAITALFRHPLGVPIPHTAIIPRRKDRIGRSLGNFVQHNFLSREVLGARLRAAGLARRAAEWVGRPENSRTVAGYAAGALRGVSTVVQDEDVLALIDRSVVQRLRQVPIAPVVARGLELLTTDDRHQQLFDRLIATLARLVTDNEVLIREKIRQESPWWVPDVVDDRIHDRIVGGIERTLREVAFDPDHPLRRHFDDQLADFIVRLQEEPRVIARAEAIKAQLLDAPASRELSVALWEEIKRGLARHAAGTDDGERQPGAVERSLDALSRALLGDEVLLAKVDGWLVDAVLAVVEEHRHQVGELIAHTVAAWDADDTSRRIELAVGRDLQFIRINGTLVGGLVGLLLHALSTLL